VRELAYLNTENIIQKEGQDGEN